MRAASSNRTVLGNVVPEVRAGEVVQNGRMPSDFTLHFELVFKLRNSDKFYECLESISDPSSPDYGNFLDAAMLQPYLPTVGQKLSVASYLLSMGMTVEDEASPLTLEVSAPVRTVESAFGVRMNLYARNLNSGFYALDADPVMPENFASIVDGFLGLDNYTRPLPVEHPCSGPYCPQGIQIGYSLSSLYSNGYDGTGQKVAIVDVPGDPNIQASINAYSTQYGLPPTTLDIRYPKGLPSSYDLSWAIETALDVEAVHAVAPKATIVLIYDEDPMNAIDYVAANHLASVVSNSWLYVCGLSPCSDAQLPPSLVSSVDSRLAVDSAQGVTLLFASGDYGAKPDGSNFGTMFPASDPNVLAIGGTKLALSGCGYYTCSGYSGEVGASLSGGGYSGYFPEPSWQTSAIGARPGRAVPDVSMFGQDPYFWTYVTGRGWLPVAGTSLSTPLWAGFLAITLQLRAGSSLGNLGPWLYQVASSPSYSSLFHDVVSGSNGYSAIQGWDPVTGWGTPIASLLAPILASFPLQVTMTMSYSIVDGGSPAAPIFNYIHGGASMNTMLTTAPVRISVDDGSVWSVTPNPLSGSTSKERWWTLQPINGTAASRTIVLTYQHQYNLTMQSDPPNAGVLAPGSGWQDAGKVVSITAAANNGYVFISWNGSGYGSYTGTDNPAKVTMNWLVEETAIFQPLTVGISLNAGWNLVSLPLVPKDASIATVLSHQIASNEVAIVWSYTGTPRTWKSFIPGKASTLTMINDGEGYWIYMRSNDTLYVDGYVIAPAKTPPSYMLVVGWNLIGFKPQPNIENETVGTYLSSITGSYDQKNVWVLDNSSGIWVPATDSTWLRPGDAMWILVKTPGTLRP